MKKIIALLLIVVFCLPLMAACTKTDKTTGTTEAPSSTVAPTEETTEESTEIPVADQNMKYGYGVYNIMVAETGKDIYLDKTNKLIENTDEISTLKNRFTFHIKERIVDGVMTKFYAIYTGDDENYGLGVTSMLPGSAKIDRSNIGYQPGEKHLWTIEDYEDGTCRIVPKTSLPKKPMCLGVKDGAIVPVERDDNDKTQLFRIEKAEAHPKYYEYTSKNGEVVVRVEKDLIDKKRSIVTHEYMQDYANYFELAVNKEVELTGFRPYDIFLISGWEDLALAAGVGDNYNVITAGKDFMNTEMTRMAYNRGQGVIDLSFGMLHELGHMFDSQRGWNFESEAWTDLKLCYVIDKLSQEYKAENLVFVCSPLDYPQGVYFTYEQMAECYDIHAKKGAMETVYGFYGAARLFVLMTYDFGWEPFIKTFHWYQDNGYTASSFERYERFTIFVDKLSEYSGEDIKKDHLSENNWKVLEEYYTGKSNTAV